MRIYGSSFSPFVRKLLICVAEAGIDHELVQVGLGDPEPGFRAASPLGKMPAMDDDGFTLADSSAIIHYLDAKHGSALVPADPRARGRAIWFEEFADTELFGALQPMFFNRVVAPLFLRRAGDGEAAARAEAGPLRRVMDYLDAAVAEPGGPLAGDQFGIADAAVASCLVNFVHCADACSLDDWPRSRAWAEAAFARPSIAPLLAKESAILARLREAAPAA